MGDIVDDSHWIENEEAWTALHFNLWPNSPVLFMCGFAQSETCMAVFEFISTTIQFDVENLKQFCGYPIKEGENLEQRLAVDFTTHQKAKTGHKFLNVEHTKSILSMTGSKPAVNRTDLVSQLLSFLECPKPQQERGNNKRQKCEVSKTTKL